MSMTVEDLQNHLRAAHARIGGEGRFALTLSEDGQRSCYVTHWFRPEPHAFEDCKVVGDGSVSECVEALERYVASYCPQPILMAAE